MNPLRIAIVGLGTVGIGVLRLLRQNAEIITARAGRSVQVVAVSARDRGRDRGYDLDGLRWEDDPRRLAVAPDIDAVVEVVGGAEGMARELCEAALGQGKSVVTANKALIAIHGAALAELAEINKASLMFEAAVAGGLPVIKTVREGLVGNRMLAVQGILNGTCNYILTKMRDTKADFAAVLGEAQALGYAEADPAMDIDGRDTAHKLAILAALAFGAKPHFEAITVEGIGRVTQHDLQLAAELGYGIKLLGVARLGEQGLEQRVGPCLVPLSSPLARIDDVLNAVLLRGDTAGEVTLIGRGAGAGPTASAVVADIVDLARGHETMPFAMPAADLRHWPVAPVESRRSGWYVRLLVKDQSGVVADIAAILRDESISIASLLQHGRSLTGCVPVVIITHEINEAALLRAVTKIAALDVVKEAPCWMRIETTERN